ncbi:MAG: mechanosensitive ion channel [Planctomycetaceae bacterium]|nr:mechanosensitive ion channel [Planctomycetaceae bacterium]
MKNSLLFAQDTVVENTETINLLEMEWPDIIQTFGISLLTFFCFYLAAKILQKVAERVGRSQHIDADLAVFLGRVVKTSVMILGLVTALSALGVDISALVAGLGLTGFALGFALKDVISNVLAGILILIYKPFVKTNYIKVKGYEGTVISTDLRYTVLQAGNETKLFVPNSLLFVDAISVAPDAPAVDTNTASD